MTPLWMFDEVKQKEIENKIVGDALEEANTLQEFTKIIQRDWTILLCEAYNVSKRPLLA